MKALLTFALSSMILACSALAVTGAPPASGNYSGKIAVITASTNGASTTLKTSQIIKAHYDAGSPGALRIYYQAIPRLGAIASQPFDYVTVQVDGSGTGSAQIQIGQTNYTGVATTTARTIKLSFTGGTDPDWLYDITLTRLAK